MMHTCKKCQTSQSWNEFENGLCDKCWENSPKELCNIVYDTLMQNSQHEQFNPSECEDVECHAHIEDEQGITAPYIFIEWRGKKYSISIDEL